MKKLLRKTLKFLFGLFVLIGLILFYTASTHEFQPSGMYYSDDFNDAFYGKSDYKLISIGNSKSLSAIDKVTLEMEMGTAAVRLGYTGADISTNRLILESYLNKCKKPPEVVLLEVSWASFNDGRTYFHKVAGDLFLTDLKLWKRAYKYFPDVLHNLRTSVEDNLRSKIQKKPPTSYDSYVLESSPTLKSYEFDLERFEFFFPDQIAGVGSSLFEDYQAILSMCEENNIELILYNAPEDEEYVAYQIDRDEVLKVIRETGSFQFLDFTMGSDLYRKSFELWMQDHNHINERDLFTKVLTDEIKKRGISIK